MKKPLHVLAALCLSTIVQTAHTADVDNYLIAKGQEFRQTNSASPVQIPAEEPFRAFTSVMPTAPGLITNATLRLPSAVVVNLETNEDGSFEAEATFTNKTQLDAQVKPGTYTFNIFTLNNGTNKPTLTLPADAYPPTPQVLNWLDAQEVDHHLDFSLQWAPFTNGTANDFIVFSISNTNDEDVVSTPGILETNTLTGTNTSAVVAAGNLQASTTYQGRLLFVKRTSTNTNGIPGALGIAGYYKQTIFPLVTLPEDTGAGRIEIGARNFSVSEAYPGELLVPIYRSSASLTGELSVTLTIADGTAQHGLDFDVNNLVSVITFSNGVGYAGISVRPIDDFLFEGNETLTFSLSNPTGGATLGSRSNAIVTILDNETATAGRLQFSPVTYNVTEAGKQALLTVTRTGGTVGNVSIAYETHNGSAIGGLDFTPTNGVLNFAAGQASRQIIVPIINDTLDETNESFTVSLNTTTGGAYLGSNLVATVTITDDDTAGTVQFKSAALSTNEFAPAAVVTVVRSGGLAGNVTVYCDTQNGTTNGATSGVDYSNTQVVVTFNSNELTRTFSIPLINDFEVETNETIFLRMIDPTGGARIGAISNAVVTILDDESNISFTNVAYTATETGLKATINLVRNGARITPVAVSYSTLDGTATSTNDYRGTNNSVVFFPPNVGFKTITIPIVNDTIVDSNETFSVFLHSPTGGVTLGTITNTTVTIKEDDAGGVISFTVTNFSITEVGPAAKILLARTGGKAGAVTVNLSSADDTATAGLDYTGINTNVTFNAGELAKTILVPVANDSLDETNETVLLALSNPTGGASIGSKSNAVLTILDDDVGGTLSLSSATYTTNENGGAFIVTVNRTIGKASAAGVSFSTFDGTALGGEDYGATEGILTFGSNELSKVITIGITNDTVAEGNETFSLRIFNPTGGATLGANTNATLTIRDDESSVSFTNAAYSVSEAGPVISVNVIRTGALVTPVSVSFSTVDAEAVSTNDYPGTNGIIVFPPNVGFKTITIPIENDTIVEGAEAFSIFLHSPSNGVQLGTITNTVVTINDNDQGGVINFKATAFITNEFNNAVITLTRTNGTASGVSVDFTTQDGSATQGLDYSNATQTVTFGAGETSRNVIIPIIKDSLDETDETVQIFLSNAQHGATLGVVSNAVLTITDDDSGGVINFKTASQSTNENAGTLLVTVVRSGGAASGVTVDYSTQSGSAIAGADFLPSIGTLTFASNELSKTISITISNDVIAEGNENFTLSLTNVTGGAILGAINTTTLTLIDDESSVAFTNVAYSVTEAGPAISVNVLRSGALVTAVSVNFNTADDSAVSPSDYRVTNGTILFPAGIGFRTITIPILEDTIVEGGEAFGIFLHSPSNGLQLGTITNTVVNIADNDLGGIINFKSAAFSTNESSNAIITITRTNGAASGVSVTFSAEGGSASSPADYAAGLQTVTFAANQTSTNVVVTIINDALDETNETVNLFLGNVQGGGTLGVVSNAVLTILDNDSGGTIQFSSLNYTTNEGAGVILATVIRTNGLANNVTVDFLTQNGTALAETDYTNTTGTLTFNAGETNKTIAVGIIDDILPDGNKNFSLSLTNPTGGAVLGVRSNATMNITDDENSVVIESASYTTNEAAGAIAIKVVRSGVLTSAVTVLFSTANDSAVSPGDYIGTNRTLNFPAGSGLQTVIIPIVNDTIDESDETFTVALSNPVGGVQIGSTSNAVVTITDNDTAGSVQFSGTSYNVTEATNNAAIRITRTGGLASGVTFQFKTTTGTATPVADYTATTNTVTFNAGESNKVVLVPIVADGVTESNETVNLVLSLPTGGATLGSPSAAVLTISDAPDVNAVPLAGSPFFNATITGTNLTFNRTLNITTWGGTSSGLNTSMFTNAPASNIVAMVAQKSANSLVNGTQLKVVRDNITFNVFQILGLGPRPFGTPPLGTVIYQFEDTINGVGTLYVAQWESGLVKIDGMSFNGNGDLTGVSGRMDIIVKADTNERFRIVGSFRTKP